MNDSQTPPYYGPVEALTEEQAAARFGISVQTLREHYDGPVAYLAKGQREKRYPAYGLHAWLISRVRFDRRGDDTRGSDWDYFGNDKAGVRAGEGGSA